VTNWSPPQVQVVDEARPTDLRVLLVEPDDLTAAVASGLPVDAAGELAAVAGTTIRAIANGLTTRFVGLGPRRELDRTTMRRIGAAAARQPTNRSIAIHGLPTPLPSENAEDLIEAFTEGLMLATYRFDRYRTPKAGDVVIDEIRIIGRGRPDLEGPIAAGILVGAAMTSTRDMVNESASVLTPRTFADRASVMAADSGLDVRVLDETELARERCGGILGIGRGSAEPPRLVALSTRTPRPTARIALVGKGITFDAGGLFLKGPESIVTMKGDMAGAAAILSAVTLAPIIAPDVEVRAFLALAENMPGDRAIKPGDIVTARNGKTIDVNDTDAEGRVVLADALSMASETEPDAIVDIATLTGAKSHALGAAYAAMFATNDALARRLGRAGERAGEPVWQMPLVDAYRPRMDSPIADLRVYDPSPSCPDAIHAALFLREFVPSGIPWAHLDIAGSEIAGRGGDVEEGMATGFGTRLLIELVRGFARP
jgi:leucyl aminopeptidase